MTRRVAATVFGIAVGVLMVVLAALIASLAQPLRPVPVPPLGPSYCEQIGDSNCDGMIVPSEPGWSCVPPEGGPLRCPPAMTGLVVTQPGPGRR